MTTYYDPMTGTCPHGTTVYIVDEEGGTFAFFDRESADEFYKSEQRAGADDLTRFTIRAPRDGMTLYDLAEHACQNGPDQ